MGCPPVRGDNPRALASGLSFIEVDKHGITILYDLHQCILAHHEIFRAKVGKDGIRMRTYPVYKFVKKTVFISNYPL